MKQEENESSEIEIEDESDARFDLMELVVDVVVDNLIDKGAVLQQINPILRLLTDFKDYYRNMLNDNFIGDDESNYWELAMNNLFVLMYKVMGKPVPDVLDLDLLLSFYTNGRDEQARIMMTHFIHENTFKQHLGEFKIDLTKNYLKKVIKKYKKLAYKFPVLSATKTILRGTSEYFKWKSNLLYVVYYTIKKESTKHRAVYVIRELVKYIEDENGKAFLETICEYVMNNIDCNAVLFSATIDKLKETESDMRNVLPSSDISIKDVFSEILKGEKGINGINFIVPVAIYKNLELRGYQERVKRAPFLRKEIKQESGTVGWLFYMAMFGVMVALMVTWIGSIVVVAPISTVYLMYAVFKYHKKHSAPRSYSIQTLTRFYGLAFVGMLSPFMGFVNIVLFFSFFGIFISIAIVLVTIFLIPTLGSILLYTFNDTFGEIPGSKFFFY